MMVYNGEMGFLHCILWYLYFLFLCTHIHHAHGFSYVSMLLPLNKYADPCLYGAVVLKGLILYLIEMSLNTFANRADPDQAVLFAYGNMIDPTRGDLTSNFIVLCTNMNIYLYNYS